MSDAFEPQPDEPDDEHAAEEPTTTDSLIDRLRGTGVGVEDPNIVGDVGPTDIPPGTRPRQRGRPLRRPAGAGRRAEPAASPAATTPMDWTGDRHEVDGVLERGFVLEVDGRRVPGVLWTPPDAEGARPLVLIGHGATAHKRYDYVVSLARELVRRHGFAAVAIDGAGHGDRRANPGDDDMTIFSDFLGEWSRDGSTDEAVADWRATLDAVRQLPEVGDGPVGYWGLSMGTIFGVPLVAAERRIQVAVFGLMGLVGPTRERMAVDARTVDLPAALHPAVGRLPHPPGLQLRAVRRPRLRTTSGCTPRPASTRRCRPRSSSSPPASSPATWPPAATSSR